MKKLSLFLAILFDVISGQHLNTCIQLVEKILNLDFVLPYGLCTE